MTRSDLAAFLSALSESTRSDPGKWENTTLEAFLRAWSNWLDDMDGYFENRGLPVPEVPSWQLIAQMLLAAAVYE